MSTLYRTMVHRDRMVVARGWEEGEMESDG